MASGSDPPNRNLERNYSISAASQTSQTAQDFIASQLQLEADAREALPYQFDTCTYPLGPLRQGLFSCLTCNPPPSDPEEPYNPAGVCYACSISCHGEHELVELFTRRNFVCDCGTTRMPDTSSCSLRMNAQTGLKGGVQSDEGSATNTYNHNFRNRFCGCGELYDAHKEKGTMFQCLGLGTVEDGGCGEDWWHPECVVGLGRGWYSNAKANNIGETLPKVEEQTNGHAAAMNTDPNGSTGYTEEEQPMPPGFPNEEDFEFFLCYKCVEAFPWIKRYAGSEGFLPAIENVASTDGAKEASRRESVPGPEPTTTEELKVEEDASSRKRKAEDEDGEAEASNVKRAKSSGEAGPVDQSTGIACKHARLPPITDTRTFSLCLKDDFREHLCRCATCFPLLLPHPQLLEEEEPYEPPLSASSAAGDGGGGDGSNSVGSRSLLERGEAALSNVDRVRAIEGVMVYNHLRDKVKDFLKPFAESGTAVSADDIKQYFEKLRGDNEAMKAAGKDISGEGGSGEPDNRREQGGY